MSLEAFQQSTDSESETGWLCGAGCSDCLRNGCLALCCDGLIKITTYRT